MKRSIGYVMVALVGVVLVGCTPEQQPEEKVAKQEQKMCPVGGCPEPEEPPPPTSCPSGYILMDGACKKKMTCPTGYEYDPSTLQCARACGCGGC